MNYINAWAWIFIIDQVLIIIWVFDSAKSQQFKADFDGRQIAGDIFRSLYLYQRLAWVWINNYIPYCHKFVHFSIYKLHDSFYSRLKLCERKIIECKKVIKEKRQERPNYLFWKVVFYIKDWLEFELIIIMLIAMNLSSFQFLSSMILFKEG